MLCAHGRLPSDRSYAIRRLLTESAGARVRQSGAVLGLEAYKAAGGTVLRGLFLERVNLSR